jgi:hypothetical protein
MTNFSVGGEDDRWVVYDRPSAEGFPLVVRTRTGNEDLLSFARSNVISAVRFVAGPGEINDYRMPANMGPLYDLEDQLIAHFAENHSGTYQLATVTGEGQRVLYFADERSLLISDTGMGAQAGGYSVHVDRVEDVEAFWALVTLSAVERQVNGDQNVIANLKKNGDDGTTPRKTDFWFYGPKDQLQRLIEDLPTVGLALDHWLDDETGVVATRITAVDIKTFRGLTPLLVQCAERNQVTYDGWETLVLKGGAEAGIRAPASPAQPSKSLFKRLFGQKNT